jgi:hypothetical protein
MEASQIVNKIKDNAFNVAIILFAFLISYNIYKKQNREYGILFETKAGELKKNEVLARIIGLEKKTDVYKNLLRDKDENLLMRSINEIAREANVRIISIRPSSQQAGSEYILESPFELTVETEDYHALGSFISKVENYADFYLVEQLNIQYAQDTEKFTARLRLSYVVFKN